MAELQDTETGWDGKGIPGAAITVRALNVMSDAVWSFRNNAPQWYRSGTGGVVFDPFPGYPHDLATVADTVTHVQRCCPPLWDVDLYLADREEVGRSNGFSNVHAGSRYVGDTLVKDPPRGLIVLSGKRVPPHPAMSRYLVAHEYGHNVQYMISHARGLHSYWDDDLLIEYAAMRGLPTTAVHPGEGGTWHDSAGEIFACDFRTYVCDVEAGFWPHPGVPPTDEIAGMADWWEKAMADLNTTR